ncbi:hypothetical protein C8F01DRAFT_1083292 [Mycena amicta]|nr:hypothetical protein C8F01DRAFT_1083292 [Mycena amicta]
MADDTRITPSSATWIAARAPETYLNRGEHLNIPSILLDSSSWASGDHENAKKYLNSQEGVDLPPESLPSRFHSHLSGIWETVQDSNTAKLRNYIGLMPFKDILQAPLHIGRQPTRLQEPECQRPNNCGQWSPELGVGGYSHGI